MGVWKSWNREPDFWLKAELGHVVSELIFKIFMNDLVYAVKQSRFSAYADDTQIVLRQYGRESGRGNKFGSSKC